MIKMLILYYLSLKSTHGYEIQKFIQVHELDQWTKIQSGSIYYALAKLEKEGLIQLKDEIFIGDKKRKVYTITQAGIEELQILIKRNVSTLINEVGSDKFFMYPILTSVSRDELEIELNHHIENLQNKVRYLERWRKVKINDNSMELEKLSFEMMLSNLHYQIKWHKQLLRDADLAQARCKTMKSLIRAFDFARSKQVEPETIQNMDDLLKQTYGIDTL